MPPEFNIFFRGESRLYLDRAIDLALEEDGADLTSEALFSQREILHARLLAKEPAVAAGLPLIQIILDRLAPEAHKTFVFQKDGDFIQDGTILAKMEGPACAILKAERVILNFITHMSGIATLTRKYVNVLQKTRTKLLDTRKTLPGLRYPEKYAVLCGGGFNHRLNLAQMLMLKDNHIDRAGSITGAVTALRNAYDPCPPIEVECRTFDDVREAVAAGVNRIMLDNMTPNEIIESLKLIPDGVESEISGGVSLENLPTLAVLGATYLSVGRLTHSAPASDFSLQVEM